MHHEEEVVAATNERGQDLIFRAIAVRSLADRRRKAPIDFLLAASRLRYRPYRALHSLMPPLRLMNSASGSFPSFCISTYRSTLLHLLRVRLSALAGSVVHRNIAA